MAICSNNATIKLNYLKGKSDSYVSNRAKPSFLFVTGNSLCLLQRGDFDYSRMRETTLIHSCNNYVSRVCYRNANVGAYSKSSVDCHNRSLPPISDNLEVRENKNTEQIKDNTAGGEGKDATGNKEILSNTSRGVGVSRNHGKVQFSLAFKMSSLPVMKAATGLGMFKLDNVVQSRRCRCKDTVGPSSPLRITTVAFSSAANRQRIKASPGFQPMGATRSQSKMPVKPSVIDVCSPICVQNCSLGKDVARESSHSMHKETKESAAGLPPAGQKREPQLKEMSESQQPSCATHNLIKTDTPAETKSDMPKTEPSSNCHNNNLYDRKQHSETNSSLYWQFDSNKHLQQATKPQPQIIKKKYNLTPNSSAGRDFINEKAKSQKDAKISQDKHCKNPVEPAKSACHEKINVEKIIAGVSFHRWSNTPQTCESDYQLLKSSVRASMGPTLAERQDEKLRKKGRRALASSRSCLSLLLEEYKKNKQRCPPSAKTGKRKRKRLFPRKKTVKEARAK